MAGDERDTFYKNSVFVHFCKLSHFPVVFSSLSPSLFAPAGKAVIKLWCFPSLWTSLSDSLLPKVDTKTVPDPDLEIRRGGWAVIQPLHKGGAVPPPIFFSAVKASVWFKNKGGPWPPAPPPGSATARVVPCHSSVIFSDFLYVRHLYKTHNGSCPSTMHLR